MLGPSEMELGQFPPLPGSARQPWPHNELGNSLCLKNTFVHHTDYGSSFLSALVLYLLEYVQKFCRSGLTLNKEEPTSAAGFFPGLQPPAVGLSPSPHPLTQPCTSIVTKICAFRSERATQPDPGTLLSRQLSCEPKLEVPARSWPGERAWDS